MVRRLDGARKRSRHKMKKDLRTKGKIGLTRYLKEFRAGDKAALSAEPSYHKGMYPLKLHGRIVTVNGKAGKCYEVFINDGKRKTLLVHPVHLRKV